MAALRELRSNYASTADTTEVTIVSYALSKDALSGVMQLRGRLALVLHAFQDFDVQAVRTRLERLSELQYERAIVLCRVSCSVRADTCQTLTIPLQLGMHDETLKILASTLRDTASANAYCTQAGSQVLNPRLVREILDKLAIPLPTALYRKDGRRKFSTPTLPALEREERRSGLLNSLIKITLQLAKEDNTPLARQSAAHTIETQAIRLTASEILPSIPDEWPLPLMESFMVRDLRRSLHRGYERKLTKAILQGKALDANLHYWEVMDSMGAILAEETGGDDERGVAPDDESIVYLEKSDGNAEDEKAVDLL